MTDCFGLTVVRFMEVVKLHWLTHAWCSQGNCLLVIFLTDPKFEDMIDHPSNFSSCKIKAWKKNSGLNRIRTHDLCDTGAVLYQLSYQAIKCLSCVHNCHDQSCLHIFLRSSIIWSFIYSFAFSCILRTHNVTSSQMAWQIWSPSWIWVYNNVIDCTFSCKLCYWKSLVEKE